MGRNMGSSASMNRSDSWLPVSGLFLLCAGVALWQFDAPLDHRIFDALRVGSDDALALPAAGLSSIGGIAFMGPLALVAIAWLTLRQRQREALWLFLTIGSGRIMIGLLKYLLERARPPGEDRLAMVTSFSFPSSHSAGSMMTCLALAMLFTLRGRSLIAPAMALAIIVGWSRIALGVHWPGDVLAGLGFGMLWVGAARHWLAAPRL
jgi:membrane-associated phospholipid phosphatase